MIRERWQALGVCVFLAGVIWLIYAQTPGHDFVNYDDNEYVYQNPQVSRGLSWTASAWAFTHVHSSNWHPLTTLSHMLDCEVFGLRPAGHHFHNVLLHAGVAVLLFLVLQEMTAAFWPSALVATLFAVHPLRVESVAWVAERKDVLSGLFFMLTLWSYVRYVRNPRAASYALVLLVLGLGLLTKPMLVTLPFVLLLLDYWPLDRWKPGTTGGMTLRKLIVEKWPMFVLVAASCVVTMIAQREALQSFERIPPLSRLGNAVAAYGVYLGQMFWPVDLAVFYPFKSVGPLQVLFSIALLSGISIGCYLARHTRPYLWMGWLWYVVMLVPVIGIVQVGGQSHADRYTYLPQIGLSIGLIWLVAEWAGRKPSRKTVAACLALGLLSTLIVAARRQASSWRDSVILWTHTLACTKENALARNNFGNVLLQQKKIVEAIAEYHEALRIYPSYAEARNNLGNALLQQGKTSEAIAELGEALRIDSAHAKARQNLGNALLQQGRIEEAIAEYREALRINPDLAEAHNDFGNALLQQGRIKEAIAEYREALRINPAHADVHYNLGNAFFQQGTIGDAIAEYREALRISPAHAQAHNNLGNGLFREGKAAEAISAYREALRINPAHADAHYNLGNVLLQTGRPAEAVQELQEAFELQPGDVGIQANLAWQLATITPASLRDGARAIALAREANERIGSQKNPLILRVLAAAYAQDGKFPEAVQTAARALQLAREQSNAELADSIMRELHLYSNGSSFPESP